MADSRARDRLEPPRGQRSPRVHTKSSVAIDDLLDLLREAGTDDVDQLDEDELPYYWLDRCHHIESWERRRPTGMMC